MDQYTLPKNHSYFHAKIYFSIFPFKHLLHPKSSIDLTNKKVLKLRNFM